MTCPACTTHASNPLTGRHNLRCLQCCTRLVLKVPRSRSHQEAMLAAIARTPKAPGRDEVLASVRQCREKQASAGPRCTTA